MLHHRAYAQAAGRALTCSDFVTGEVWIPKEGASRSQVYIWQKVLYQRKVYLETEFRQPAGCRIGRKVG